MCSSDLTMMNLRERDEAICNYLIWNIDDNGYLLYQIDEEFIKGLKIDPPCTVEEAEDCLELIQDFEPPGVGARDLRECLLIQLENSNVNHCYDLEIVIVRDFLDDVVSNRLPKIAKALNESIEQIDEAVKFIQISRS